MDVSTASFLAALKSDEERNEKDWRDHARAVPTAIFTKMRAQAVVTAASLSLFLSVRLSVCLSVCLFARASACMFAALRK